MTTWFYRCRGEQFGPMSWDELRLLIKPHRLDAADPVSQDGVIPSACVIYGED